MSLLVSCILRVLGILVYSGKIIKLVKFTKPLIFFQITEDK